MNEVAFKTAVLTNSAEECPDCSEMLAYSKRDYFLNNPSTQFYPTKKRIFNLVIYILMLKQ